MEISSTILRYSAEDVTERSRTYVVVVDGNGVPAITPHLVTLSRFSLLSLGRTAELRISAYDL
jgi:hypothetical protein